VVHDTGVAVLHSFSVPLLLLLFVAASGAVWIAGIKLSDTTDVLEARFNLGQTLGGVILLAIATNLPEIAITASAAWKDQVGIAIGNILGGVAIQTLVLVLLDAFSGTPREPLTSRAASLTLALEGVLVISVLIVAIMASRLPASLIFARVAPGELLIFALWIAGVWIIGKSRTEMPWRADDLGCHEAKGNPGGPRNTEGGKAPNEVRASTWRAAFVFSAAAMVTLVAGVVLEESGTEIADHLGMSGVLFGATVLAASTALPEVSTGLRAVRLGDDRLAVSDIFGGNAFLPVLFPFATLISGRATLPQAQNTDIYLACLGILLTCPYIVGLTLRPGGRRLRVGLDSLVALCLYLVGAAGLVPIILAAGHG
jgi:cation:H+ antiporter